MTLYYVRIEFWDSLKCKVFKKTLTLLLPVQKGTFNILSAIKEHLIWKLFCVTFNEDVFEMASVEDQHFLFILFALFQLKAFNKFHRKTKSMDIYRWINQENFNLIYRLFWNCRWELISFVDETSMK